MPLAQAAPNGPRPSPDGDHGAERRQLVLLAAAAGCVATAGVAIPLVSSLAPSERARAMGASVEVDISERPWWGENGGMARQARVDHAAHD